MVDPSILKSVRDYLQNLRGQGLPVSFGVVFGSQTTGAVDEWSDIDLVVVSSRFDNPNGRDDVNLLWRVAARTCNRIEPVPCGERQWREDMATPIIELARRQGARVTLDGQ